MDFLRLSVANSVDPFTLDAVEELGDDSLILINGALIVCVSGSSLLQFIKSEMANGKGLEDMGLDFQDADSMALSCDVWVLCLSAENNYLVELMALIASLRKSKIDYTERLAALDHEVMLRLRFFIHDLLVLGKEKDARVRVEANLGSPFYMSDVYFTAVEADTIMAFKGKNGLTLRNVLEAAFDKTTGELCAAHTLAPILQRHFSVPQNFRSSAEYSRSYKSFCKKAMKKAGRGAR